MVPKKAQICPCSGLLTPISTPESDSPRKITSIKGLGRFFFSFLHKKRLAGQIFSEGTNFFCDWPYVGWMYRRFTTQSFNPLGSQTKKLSKFSLRDRFFPRAQIFFTIDPMWTQHIAVGKNLSGHEILELYTVKALRWRRAPKTKKLPSAIFLFLEPGVSFAEKTLLW